MTYGAGRTGGRAEFDLEYDGGEVEPVAGMVAMLGPFAFTEAVSEPRIFPIDIFFKNPHRPFLDYSGRDYRSSRSYLPSPHRTLGRL